MKRHLAWQASGPVKRGACGHAQPRQWTRVPSEVTCFRCQRTLRMAVAEIQEQQKKRSNRPFIPMNRKAVTR